MEIDRITDKNQPDDEAKNLSQAPSNIVAYAMQSLKYINDAKILSLHIRDIERYLAEAKQKQTVLIAEQEAAKARELGRDKLKSELPPYVMELLRKGHHAPFERAAKEFDTFPEHAERLFNAYCKFAGYTPRMAFVGACASRGLRASEIASKYELVYGKSISKRTIEREVRKIKTGKLGHQI